jgi:uncharacterized membrane protein
MPSALIHGPSGHPLHPPLTDVAIGGYTTATVLAVLGALDVSEDAMGKAAWLALLVGLAGAALAALTGLVDLLRLPRPSPAFRTGVIHGIVNAAATMLFLLAAVFQYDGFHDGSVTTSGLVLMLIAFALVSVGGYLGGALVFRHGVRVERDVT